MILFKCNQATCSVYSEQGLVKFNLRRNMYVELLSLTAVEAEVKCLQTNKEGMVPRDEFVDNFECVR